MNNFMTTTTYLLCNYSNKKGSHCSSLSIISLSARQRKEFRFLRHSCVQSLPSYICIQPGNFVFLQLKASVSEKQQDWTFPLVRAQTTWQRCETEAQSGNPIQSTNIAVSSTQTSEDTFNQRTSLSWCKFNLAYPVSCIVSEAEKNILKKKQNTFFKKKTAKPKISSDQYVPSQVRSTGATFKTYLSYQWQTNCIYPNYWQRALTFLPLWATLRKLLLTLLT